MSYIAQGQVTTTEVAVSLNGQSVCIYTASGGYVSRFKSNKVTRRLLGYEATRQCRVLWKRFRVMHALSGKSGKGEIFLTPARYKHLLRTLSQESARL